MAVIVNSRALMLCVCLPIPQNANYAVQNGCTLTRARVLRFKHNDVADLERVLAGVAKEDLKSKCGVFARYPD